MNIVFVTVGTSAIANEAIWESDSALARCAPRDIRQFLDRLEDGEAPPPELEDLLFQAHRKFWERNDNDRLNPKNRLLTSAEAISTYSARVSGLFSLTAGEDKVVLLLSNTELGKVCGRLNEKLFCDYMFYPVPGKAVNVTTKTIEALSPTGLNERAATVYPIYPEISRIISELLDGNDAGAFFNITGSYKGLIPPITRICSKHQYRDRSTMLYMHESMPVTVALTFDDREEMNELVVTRTRASVRIRH